MYPDLYNYDLASLTQQSEDSLATVASVTEAVTSVVKRLGWDKAGVTLVMINTGVTQLVTDSLVMEAEICVRRVIHLNLNYLTSPAWRTWELAGSRSPAPAATHWPGSRSWRRRRLAPARGRPQVRPARRACRAVPTRDYT